MSSDALKLAIAEALDLGVSADDTRLLKIVGDRHAELKGDGRLRRVRTAARRFAEASTDTADAPLKDAPPADWPFWSLTRGKSAVIVGGSPRAENRDRLREAFGFASVEWPEHDAAVLSQLAERTASGSIDICIFNRFAGHIVDNIVLKDIRKERGRWVRVEHGYGVSEVRTAIERQWAALVATTAK